MLFKYVQGDVDQLFESKDSLVQGFLFLDELSPQAISSPSVSVNSTLTDQKILLGLNYIKFLFILGLGLAQLFIQLLLRFW